MAGFFGHYFDYNKPGKGVNKNAPEKRPFFLFFELVRRKFWRLILFNLIYFVFLLPILTGIYFLLYNYVLSWLAQANTAGVLEGMGTGLSNIQLPLLPGLLLSIAQTLPVWLNATLLVVSVIFYGPASCGLAFILRNFARQQHAWNTDFFSQLKRNFKQGLVLGLLDIFLLSLFIFDLSYTATGNWAAALTVSKFGSGVLLIVWLFMRNYIFLIAVTFNLKVSQIVKNAFSLSALGLWRNLLILVVNAVLLAFTLFVWQITELVLLPFLLLSFTGFVSVFTCFPVVKKYLLDPQTPATEDDR